MFSSLSCLPRGGGFEKPSFSENNSKRFFIFNSEIVENRESIQLSVGSGIDRIVLYSYSIKSRVDLLAISRPQTFVPNRNRYLTWERFMG